MILKLTRTTAELLGESALGWQKLEELARLGRATSGSRQDEGRLLHLAAVLKVELRVEGIVPSTRRRERGSG